MKFIFLLSQCATNGLNFHKLQSEGQQCLQLEMFFSGFPRMVGLYLFPNLQILSLMGQPITRLEGLTPLVNLTELWVCECQIQVSEWCYSRYIPRNISVRFWWNVFYIIYGKMFHEIRFFRLICFPTFFIFFNEDTNMTQILYMQYQDTFL